MKKIRLIDSMGEVVLGVSGNPLESKTMEGLKKLIRDDTQNSIGYYSPTDHSKFTVVVEGIGSLELGNVGGRKSWAWYSRGRKYYRVEGELIELGWSPHDRDSYFLRWKELAPVAKYLQRKFLRGYGGKMIDELDKLVQNFKGSFDPLDI